MSCGEKSAATVDKGNNNTAETKLGKLFFTVKYSFEKNALGKLITRYTELIEKYQGC